MTLVRHRHGPTPDWGRSRGHSCRNRSPDALTLQQVFEQENNEPMKRSTFQITIYLESPKNDRKRQECRPTRGLKGGKEGGRQDETRRVGRA